jgi:hypothetical protein
MQVLHFYNKDQFKGGPIDNIFASAHVHVLQFWNINSF